MKKRGFSNKKATDYLVWFIILEIILVSIISTGLMYYLISVKEDTLFERNYLARDVALLSTTIESSPQDIEYVYHPEKPLQFSFRWHDNKVFVSDENGLETGFPYLSHKEGLSDSARDEKTIIFEKNTGGVNIKEEDAETK